MQKVDLKGVLKIDLDKRELLHSSNSGNQERAVSLDSSEAFELLSSLWLRSGWASKYSYSFTWLGRPIIQIPEDMVRIQEIIYTVKPDVIVETGIAHGGSLIFYASLLKLLDKGRVVGVDIDIREHNRNAIEAHELYPLITMIEGSSTDESIFTQVKNSIQPGQTVLVVLDSCHTRDHVYSELELYSQLVTPGSYLLVADGIMNDVVGAPRSQENWVYDNPVEAVKQFLHVNHDFVEEEPKFKFNEGEVHRPITYFKGGFLKCIR